MPLPSRDILQAEIMRLPHADDVARDTLRSLERWVREHGDTDGTRALRLAGMRFRDAVRAFDRAVGVAWERVKRDYPPIAEAEREYYERTRVSTDPGVNGVGAGPVLIIVVIIALSAVAVLIAEIYARHYPDIERTRQALRQQQIVFAELREEAIRNGRYDLLREVTTVPETDTRSIASVVESSISPIMLAGAIGVILWAFVKARAA